jgi:Zn-dependent protease
LGRDLGIEIVSANAIYLITIWAIPVIIAITFHEAAHGFVAYLLGDNTAWRLGRVSFLSPGMPGAFFNLASRLLRRQLVRQFGP